MRGLRIFSVSFGLTIWGSSACVTLAPFNWHFNLQRGHCAGDPVNIVFGPVVILLHRPA